MSAAKFQVYCTFNNPLYFDHLNDEIDLKMNQNNILSREELLNQVRICHGILVDDRCTVDKMILDAAGSQLKVFLLCCLDKTSRI